MKRHHLVNYVRVSVEWLLLWVVWDWDKVESHAVLFILEVC